MGRWAIERPSGSLHPIPEPATLCSQVYLLDAEKNVLWTVRKGEVLEHSLESEETNSPQLSAAQSVTHSGQARPDPPLLPLLHSDL